MGSEQTEAGNTQSPQWPSHEDARRQMEQHAANAGELIDVLAAKAGLHFTGPLPAPASNHPSRTLEEQSMQSDKLSDSIVTGHTPEPWFVHHEGNHHCVRDASGHEIIPALGNGETGSGSVARDFARLTQCVNILAGINDPATYVGQCHALFKSATTPVSPPPADSSQGDVVERAAKLAGLSDYEAAAAWATQITSNITTERERAIAVIVSKLAAKVVADYKAAEAEATGGAMAATHLQSEIDRLAAENAALRSVVDKLVTWDRKNPKGRVYPIGPNDCEKQLDAIVADARAALAASLSTPQQGGRDAHL